MFHNIKSIWHEKKDKTLSYVMEKTAGYYLKEYGQMVKFNVDSQSKTIHLNLLLKGEVENLNVDIKSYELLEENEKVFIKFNDIETSREWINTVIEYFVKDKSDRVEVPKEYLKLLNMVL